MQVASGNLDALGYSAYRLGLYDALAPLITDAKVCEEVVPFLF